ncbi:MAG: thioredoxin [Blautia producta]
MAILHIKNHDFQKGVLESQKPVILDFFATWCGPCKMLGQVLEQLDEEREDVKIVKVDIDENPSLRKEWEISTVPSVFFIKDGEVKDSAVGFLPKPVLEAKIDTL